MDWYWVQAADPSAAATYLPLFAQYGILGLLVVVQFYVLRVLFKREQERADRADEDVRNLNAAMRDSVIPALTRSTDTNREVMDALTRAITLLEEIRRERDIEAAARRLRDAR